MTNSAIPSLGTAKLKPTKIDDRIDLYVDVTPTKVRRGEIVKVSIRGVLHPDSTLIQ